MVTRLQFLARSSGYGCAIALLCLALAACQLTEVAAPATTPTPIRTPTPILPPALSPLASTAPSLDRTATPAGTPAGTPGSTPAGGPAGTPTGTLVRTTPGTTTPDRTATPIGAIGSTATPGGTTPPGGTTTPRPGSTSTPGTPGAQGTPPPSPTVARGTIQLVSYRASVQGSDYVVTGEVQNNTTFNPRTVRIAGTVYDAEGRSLDTAETTLGGDTPLQPGELRSFTLKFRSDPRIVRYYLDIETQ